MRDGVGQYYCMYIVDDIMLLAESELDIVGEYAEELGLHLMQ